MILAILRKALVLAISHLLLHNVCGPNHGPGIETAIKFFAKKEFESKT
jgi:hypothetical protein